MFRAYFPGPFTPKKQVNWQQERFHDITAKLGHFLKQAGFKVPFRSRCRPHQTGHLSATAELGFSFLQDSDVFYIPTSGLSGENLATRSSVSELTCWYSGPSLLEQIGKMSITDLLPECRG